jgi:hypothetical protein
MSYYHHYDENEAKKEECFTPQPDDFDDFFDYFEEELFEYEYIYEYTYKYK